MSKTLLWKGKKLRLRKSILIWTAFWQILQKASEKSVESCYNKGCILIDDMALNITEWENAGGTGIQNLDSASTMEKLKAMGIL